MFAYIFRALILSVCNFQSTRSPVELNSLLSKIFCYINLDDLETRPLRQVLLFLRNNSLVVQKLQTVILGINYILLVTNYFSIATS